MIKNINQQNENITPNSKELAVLKEHFPACFAADGSFDLQRFKTAIADKTNVVQEGYELKFLGKSYAKLLASTDTTTVIQPNEAHNNLPENAHSENIYISGDNLDGLKHLLKSYDGEVKCIFIDPPYNTGSDGFVYFDNFNYSKETLQEKLSVSEEEAQRILDLTKRSSASHSAWLMFMYSRLLLAKDLLMNDGVIFIAIDDNEQADLKLLCDDVFGEENFLANIVWKHAEQSKNDEKHFSRQFNYLLCYRRSTAMEFFRLPRTEKDNLNYSNPDNDPNGEWRSGDVRSPNFRRTLLYDIPTPSGKVIKPPVNGWRWKLREVEKKIKTGEIIFNSDETGIIRKIYLKNQIGRVAENLWQGERFGTTRTANAEIKDLFEGLVVFDTPKPKELVIQALKLFYGENDFIIVDFFSGSGTTAHAVVQLNLEDGGNRKFIAIQYPEVLNPEVDSQKIAFEFLKKKALPTTLDYIGIERIKRAVAKIKQEQIEIRKSKAGELFEGEPQLELDLGFRHYILSEPNQNTLDKLDSFDKAALVVDKSIIDDFGKPTILATWLNADGYGLTINAQAIDLAGYTAYYYQKHLYLIDSGFSLESMKALLSKYLTDGHFNPENVVLFGYSFPEWSINEMIEKNLRILNDGEKNLKVNFSVRY